MLDVRVLAMLSRETMVIRSTVVSVELVFAESRAVGDRVLYANPPEVMAPVGMGGGAAFVAPGVRGTIEAFEGTRARVRFAFDTDGRCGESYPLLVFEGQSCRVECRCDEVDDEQDPPMAIACPIHDSGPPE